MHADSHPLAGQTVTLRPGTCLPNNSDGTLRFRLEDWNDRTFGQSWMTMEGHPASLAYAIRSSVSGLPLDNEVVYGKDDRGFGHLVHVSELADGAQ